MSPKDRSLVSLARINHVLTANNGHPVSVGLTLLLSITFTLQLISPSFNI